jgi:Tol biopolymer transport system component/DNA-binding winged helix-turn-helix (wHTH) protein
MNKQTKHFYEFGGFRLDLNERLLLRQGKVVALTPKAFETLLALVEHSGRIVEKEFLMNRIWPDTFVEEVSLARNVSALRKALGERDSDIQYIETFPKRGYRFVADVTEHKEEADRAAEHVPFPSAAFEEVLASHSANEAGQGFGAKVGFSAQPDEQKLSQGLPQSESSVTALVVTDTHQTLAESTDDALQDESTESATGNQKLNNFLNRHKIAALVAVVALVVGVAMTAYFMRSGNLATTPFQEMKITQLTNTGKATQGAISPDGKNLTYVLSDGGERYSIWVKHIVTGSEVQIIPPAKNPYWGLTFSPDGSYIYYGGFENGRGALYQSPIFGNTSKKIIADSMPPISFSPDGSRFAFVRGNEKESSLVIANADGSGEQTLARRAQPDSFRSGPAWSPLGKIIACIVKNASSKSQLAIVEVRLEDGSEKEIMDQRWTAIDSLNWLADGKSLIMAAQDQFSTPVQIWLVSYPNGETRRVTNDLNEYRGVSLSADSHNLVTRQVAPLLNIWVAPDGDISKIKQITSGINQYGKFSWTPDGKIVAANSSGSQNIWSIEANGSGRKNLTNDHHTNDYPSVSPDGRYIVFVSNRTGSGNIWRMNSDGSNAIALTEGSLNGSPYISLDGQSVIYYRYASSGGTFWKVSIDGGEPLQLNYKLPYVQELSLDISPDGKQVAIFYRETLPASPWRIAILPIQGGEPSKTFEVQQPLAAVKTIRWLPDGQAVAYVTSPEGISNVWVQPLDGGQPRQLTNFNSEQIFYFDWSADGKQFACVRGNINRNIVSISNFK